jgi:N-acetylglucosamine kinase-like BadF-type ATPase
MLFEGLGIGTREELIEIGVQIQKAEWKNPGLPVIVDNAAAMGDEYAIGILKDAAGCTFDLADSVITKLKLNEEPAFKVGVWGSAIVKSPLHFSFFRDKMEKKYHKARVVIPKVDAATGACMIAMDLMGRGI